MARDASKFFDTFQNAINFGSPHIYISALPFAPINSRISKQFGPKFENILSLVSGRQNDWDPHIKSSRIHTSELSVVRGFLVFGGCNTGIIRTGFKNRDALRQIRDSRDNGALQFLATTGTAYEENSIRWVAFCYTDGHVDIWELEVGSAPGRLVKTIGAPGASAAVFAVDKTLILGFSDGNVTIYDPVHPSGIPTHFMYAPRTLSEGHGGAVHSLACAPGGHHFVSGSADHSLIVWDMIKGEKLRQLRGHTGAVRSVDWSANGRYIASGSDDCTNRIWNSERGEHLKTISQSGAVSSIAFCYNNLIVSGSRDGSIRFWNRKYGTPVGEPIVRNSAVKAIAFSDDRPEIGAVYDDSFVCIWDVRATCGYTSHDTQALFESEGPSKRIISIAFDFDGKRLASGSEDGDVHVWDAGTGRALASWDTTDGGAIFFVQFSRSSEGNCVRAASCAGNLHFLRPASDSKSEAQTVDITKALQWPIAISPEGEDLCISLASPSSSSSEGCFDIAVWSVSHGQCLEIDRLEGHKSRITAIAFSSDGRKIISASDDMTIRLWEVGAAQGSKAYRVVTVDDVFDDNSNHCIFSLIFSPNGDQFAMARTGKGTVYRFEIWGSVQLFQGPELDACEIPDWCSQERLHFPPCADFSPDGRVFACSAKNGVEVYDAKTYRSMIFLPDCRGPMPMKVSFDGRKIVAASAGRSKNEHPTAKVWAIDAIEFQDTLLNYDGHRRILDENNDMANTPHLNTPDVFFLDAENTPIIGDWSYIDPGLCRGGYIMDDTYLGFMRNRRENSDSFKADPCLFWLPLGNRDGYWWPRNTAVVDPNVTRIDFSRFVHGKNWHHCHTAEEEQNKWEN